MLRARAYASAVLLALVALAAPAGADVNPGFTVAVDGATRVDNPAVGQTIDLAVRAAGTTRVKGVVMRVLRRQSNGRWKVYRSIWAPSGGTGSG